MGVCEGMRGSSDLREGARLESLAALVGALINKSRNARDLYG
jgi:hypothetical protein